MPSGTYAQGITGDSAGRQILEKLGRYGANPVPYHELPPRPVQMPSSSAAQTGNPAARASSANLELPPKPQLVDDNRAASYDYIPRGHKMAYENGASPQGDARAHQQPVFQPPMFNGGFQAQPPSHPSQPTPNSGLSPSSSVFTPTPTTLNDGLKGDLANTVVLAARDDNGMRGSYKHKGRQGYQNQRNHNHMSYSAQSQEPFYAQNNHDDNIVWRRAVITERYQGAQNCKNKLSDNHQYVECDCVECSTRNRSIWMKVMNQQDGHLEDIKARIKSGLSDRFGPAEEVIPVFHECGRAFIVRWVYLNYVK